MNQPSTGHAKKELMIDTVTLLCDEIPMHKFSTDPNYKLQINQEQGGSYKLIYSANTPIPHRVMLGPNYKSMPPMKIEFRLHQVAHSTLNSTLVEITGNKNIINSARCSRTDLILDLTPRLTQFDLVSFAQKRSFKSYLMKDADADTKYLGGGDELLRIYSKESEDSDIHKTSTRLELQLRGHKCALKHLAEFELLLENDFFAPVTIYRLHGLALSAREHQMISNFTEIGFTQSKKKFGTEWNQLLKQASIISGEQLSNWWHGLLIEWLNT